jgi:hypothetical protein
MIIRRLRGAAVLTTSRMRQPIPSASKLPPVLLLLIRGIEPVEKDC